MKTFTVNFRTKQRYPRVPMEGRTPRDCDPNAGEVGAGKGGAGSRCHGTHVARALASGLADDRWKIPVTSLVHAPEPPVWTSGSAALLPGRPQAPHTQKIQGLVPPLPARAPLAALPAASSTWGVAPACSRAHARSRACLSLSFKAPSSLLRLSGTQSSTLYAFCVAHAPDSSRICASSITALFKSKFQGISLTANLSFPRCGLHVLGSCRVGVGPAGVRSWSLGKGLQSAQVGGLRCCLTLCK